MHSSAVKHNTISRGCRTVFAGLSQMLLRRLQRSSTGWSSMVGSPIDDFSIGTGNSYWILDGGLLEAENIVTSLTVPSSVNKKKKDPYVKNLVF